MDTQGLPSVAPVALAAIVLAACQAADPQPPPQYPPPGNWAPPAAPQGAPQGVPQGAPNTAMGPALTPFGMLFQLPQLPAQFPAQLPPLSDLGGWMRTSWPFPQAPSQPPGQPPMQPPMLPPMQPADPGWPAAWQAYEDEVLMLTNQRRAQGATCGDRSFGPAPAVAPHPQLRTAARGHSRDMSSRNYFDHQSPEGMGPGQRAKAAGYPSGFVGENIAAGYPTPAAVVDGWMKSPGHCLNVMEPRYRFLGVGYYQGNRGYWTQNFGG